MRRKAAFLTSAALSLGLLPLAASQASASTPPAPPASNLLSSVTVVTGSGSSTSVKTIEVSSLSEASAKAAALDALPGVQAEVTRELRLFADPLAPSQWQLAASKVPSSARATGVVVAVIDTGVDSSHPDLQGNVLPGYDAISSSAMPVSSDNAYHGTFVAGIIAASADNDLYGRGAAPGAKILPVKVCSASGSCSTDAVARGILWAVSNGAKVINLSLGGPSPSTAMEQAVLVANSAGVVVVAAAGNNGTSDPSYPAAFPSVIDVGATTQTNTRASFSQWGPAVDIAAPGVSLVSIVPLSVNSSGQGAASGTSFSSPMVAASAALAIAAFPGSTPSDVRSRILSSAAPGPAEMGGKALDVTALLSSNTPTTTTTTTTTTTPPSTTTTTPPSPTTTTTPPSPTTTTTAPPSTPPSKLQTPVVTSISSRYSYVYVKVSPVEGARTYLIRFSTGQTARTSLTSFSVIGLPTGVPISLTVQAEPFSSASAPSDASAPSQTVTNLTRPSAPVASPQNTAVSVAFSPVKGATSYRVQLSTGQAMTVSSSPAVFSGLPNGTPVTAAVTALAERSESFQSYSSLRTTPYGLPIVSVSPPLTISSSVGKVTVSWTRPSDNGSRITKVELVSAEGTVYPVPSTSSTSYTISSLTPGSSQSFSLWVTNQAGTSKTPFSLPVTVTAPPTLSYALKDPSSSTVTLSGGVFSPSPSVLLEEGTGSSWKVIATVPVVDGKFSHTLVLPAPSVQYRVRASLLYSPVVTVSVPASSPLKSGS